MTLYFQEPRSRILFKLMGGRFLAKDSGIHLDLSRSFKSGFRIGAFRIAKTDISYAEFGEGSFDKGFYFSLPIDIFFSEYSKAAYLIRLTSNYTRWSSIFNSFT